MSEQPPKPCRCFKHQCLECRTINLIPADNGDGTPYPKCCNNFMPFQGTVDGIPGIDESQKIKEVEA